MSNNARGNERVMFPGIAMLLWRGIYRILTNLFGLPALELSYRLLQLSAASLNKQTSGIWQPEKYGSLAEHECHSS